MRRRTEDAAVNFGCAANGVEVGVERDNRQHRMHERPEHGAGRTISRQLDVHHIDVRQLPDRQIRIGPGRPCGDGVHAHRGLRGRLGGGLAAAPPRFVSRKPLRDDVRGGLLGDQLGPSDAGKHFGIQVQVVRIPPGDRIATLRQSPEFVETRADRFRGCRIVIGARKDAVL